MEELGQFNDDDFKKKQEELRKKQALFEYQEKILEDFEPEIEAREQKRNRLLSWLVLFLMFAFTFFLAWRLVL